MSINALNKSCIICNILPKQFACNSKNLVYCFTCKSCNEQYIGYSAREFKFRYKEHASSINKSNSISALAHHNTTKHRGSSTNIDNFDISILKQCNDPINANLAEGIYINTLKPKINRKHEQQSIS